MSKYGISNSVVPAETFQLPYDLVVNLSGINIQIIRISHIKKSVSPWVIENHTHINWEFHYVISGSGTIETIDKEISVKQHHLYITPPLSLHKQISDSDCLEEYCIECNIIPPITPLTESANEEIVYFLNSRSILDLKSYPMSPNMLLTLNILKDELISETPSLIKLEGVLAYIMSEFIHIAISDYHTKIVHVAEKRSSAEVIAIKTYIEANLCDQESINNIADSMFTSRRQIDRMFLKQYNMTVFQYLQNLRIKTAINLIQNTSISFTEIAKNSGFANYRKMVRALHTNGYSSPSEIRNKKL